MDGFTLEGALRYPFLSIENEGDVAIARVLGSVTAEARARTRKGAFKKLLLDMARMNKARRVKRGCVPHRVRLSQDEIRAEHERIQTENRALPQRERAGSGVPIVITTASSLPLVPSWQDYLTMFVLLDLKSVVSVRSVIRLICGCKDHFYGLEYDWMIDARSFDELLMRITIAEHSERFDSAMRRSRRNRVRRRRKRLAGEICDPRSSSLVIVPPGDYQSGRCRVGPMDTFVAGLKNMGSQAVPLIHTNNNAIVMTGSNAGAVFSGLTLSGGILLTV